MRAVPTMTLPSDDDGGRLVISGPRRGEVIRSASNRLVLAELRDNGSWDRGGAIEPVMTHAQEYHAETIRAGRRLYRVWVNYERRATATVDALDTLIDADRATTYAVRARG